MVLGTPVLAISLVLVILERAIGIGVFAPAKGGDPLLFKSILNGSIRIPLSTS